MTYFSLFSGVGGFEVGIRNAYEKAKLQRTGSTRPQSGGGKESVPSEWGLSPVKDPSCVGFSEIDRFANQVLRYRFPDVRNYGDISRIKWDEVPDFDMLVGGSPCQDFSIAGKRAGIVGKRSGLVWEFIRCLEQKKPRYFIWENVKGVMSSRNGIDFGAILSTFSEKGYALWWQVLNAKDFGVPQNRERVFVIGHSGERCPREVFFKQESGGVTPKERGTGIQNLQISNTLRTNYGSAFGSELYVQTIKARDYKDFAGSTIINNISDERIRKLTPIECERLMSWDDDWTRWGKDEKNNTIEISNSQRYKMCGNGVVSKVVEVLVSNTILQDDLFSVKTKQI